MSLEGQSEMVTKTNREEVYSYPSGQGQSFAESTLSNYSYSTSVQPASSDYGYNSHHEVGGGTYISQAAVHEMSIKGESANWHLSNTTAHSLAMAGSGYGSLNMNSQYYQQTGSAQHSPSQNQNHQQQQQQQAVPTTSSTTSASAVPGTTTVKYEDRFSQQQPGQTQASTPGQTQSQTSSQPQQSTYNSSGSQDYSGTSVLAGSNGGSGSGGSGGQSQYSSYIDQTVVKSEDSPYRYNCGSTSGAGGSPGTRSLAGSSHNSQDSDYNSPTTQPSNNMYGIMGMSTTASTTQQATASVVAAASAKTEPSDAGYYMSLPTTCSTGFMGSLSAGSQSSGGGGGYSPHPDSVVNSLHQYKLKPEGGYYSSSHIGTSNSSPDYGAYGAMDRYAGYKRTSPYDRAPQQPYRQRDTPPTGITPPLGVGQNYTMEELQQHQQQQQQQQQALAQQNHHQMAAMMYMRHGGGNPSPHHHGHHGHHPHHQSDLAAMHQVLPQIESLYNRGSAVDNSRMVVSPMSHLLYGQHDAGSQGRQQMTPPMGHVVRGGSLYSQDPDMQQIQTMVQSYTGRPTDHQRPLVDMDGDPPRTTPPVVWTDPKMDFPLPEVKDISGTFLMLEKQLCEALRVLEFRSPVEYIYNPMEYAWEPHSNYVQRYCSTQKPVLFLGMNPGPFGMAQTGVPFGEVTLVKEWLGVSGQVNKPVREHPKKLILGFDCPRSEISGSRFWGFFKKYCGKPDNFFRYCFVHNICPLIFMNHNAKNITPPQLPVVERKPLNRLCSQHLCDVVRLLNTKIVIGIGKFAQDQAKMALEEAGITGVKVTWIMHPSPANPIANRGWEEVAKRQLEEMDVLKYIVDQSV